MAFIGIKVPQNISKLLSKIKVSGEKGDISEYHTTLLFFGQDYPISEISKSMKYIYDTASATKPFLIKIDTIGCFPKNPEYKKNSCPIIAKIESKELHKLQEKLKKTLDKNEIKFSKTFKDYKPHITLSYSKKEIQEFKIDSIEFLVSELVLWGGNSGDEQLSITFPLKPLTNKKSLLNYKIDYFNKISTLI